MLERRGNTIRARHILIKPAITESDLMMTKTKLDSIKNLIAIDSISFQKAVKRHGYDKVESYNNNGRMKNRRTGNTFFETDQLEDPDIYLEIIDLNVDELSNTMEFKDFGGETMFRIIQLQNMTRPHKANLKQDYDKIKRIAKESKKAEYFESWIIERKAETFVKIMAEDLKGCPNMDTYKM